MADASTRYRRPEAEQGTLGGLVVLASVLLFVLVTLCFERGLVAVPEGRILLSAWGWIHLVVWGASVAVSAGPFVGVARARIIGVLIAALAIIVNVLPIPYHALWLMTPIVRGLCVVRHKSLY
ncbi:hypothetical protein J8N05_46565 (plasmid) [Streptomyces sp. BH-SS-21]|uniref:DUF7144 domain-containing protein n=1 Tax=Streptomyces liliiviolaceus TaxID=2823109 RepID=A0A941BEU9_9ACTN|nr:hypothetical protein [Streptomyces liliiviolaceus]MBQ0855628.1 hypothetical protein [Streptomyces liliiviolaceus]